MQGGSAKDLSQEIEGSEYFENVSDVISHYEKALSKKDLLLVLGAGDLYYLMKEKMQK